MFDQLVLTNAQDSAKQARYFGITTLIYGAMIMAVLVWSVFSFDLSGLNQDDLAFNELVAPVTLPETAPVPILPDRPQPRAAAAPNARNYDEIRNPVRDITDSTVAPDKPSTVKSDVTAVRDKVPFIVSNVNTRADGGDNLPNRNNAASSLSSAITAQPKEIKDEESAPPITPKPTSAPPSNKIVTVSKGVINGIAANLPKPAYPAPARAIHAGGEVKVQVLIDERGNVLSASAVSGHPLLRAAAQAAAHQAKFTPTKLSDQPVKVTGVIIYNFVAQ